LVKVLSRPKKMHLWPTPTP